LIQLLLIIDTAKSGFQSTCVTVSLSSQRRIIIHNPATHSKPFKQPEGKDLEVLDRVEQLDSIFNKTLEPTGSCALFNPLTELQKCRGLSFSSVKRNLNLPNITGMSCERCMEHRVCFCEDLKFLKEK